MNWSGIFRRVQASAIWMLRLGLIAFTIHIFYRQLFSEHQLNDLWRAFTQQVSVKTLPGLWVALALAPLNWLFEAYKWCLLSGSKDWKAALKMVIGGSASGFVTPGRSGEFIGRAVLWKGRNGSGQVVYLSMMGGIAQLLVTLWVGAVAGWLLGYSATLIAAAFFFSTLLMLLYFLPSRWIQQQLQKIPFLGHSASSSATLSRSLLHRVLWFSAGRYLIYLFQYAGVYWFFGLSDLPHAPMVYASVLLLLYSIAPMVPFLDPGIRGGLALWVFSGSGANELGVLSATLSVWILNAALPALLGLLLIWKMPVNEFVGTAEQR